MASSSRQTDATSIPAISSTGSYTIIPHNHKAKVWEHYDLVRMADGVEKARHKLCGSMYGSNGNSTLARHHTKCESKLNPEATQAQIDNTGHTWIYDQKLQRELQMKCIISREWPFNHFDNEDSTNYIQQGLQPKYSKVVVAGYTAGQRAKHVPRGKYVAGVSILVGTAVTMFLLVLLKVFPFTPRYIIPVAGMMVGNAMTVTGVTMMVDT